MKIKKIKWRNHKVLDNLELDLTKANDTGFETVILAGENGTGKTSILETLSSFLNLGSFEHFEFIEYEIDNISYRAVAPIDGTTHPMFFDVIEV